jgi:hypothetical protein
VNRTRADNDRQAIVPAMQDFVQRLPAVGDGFGHHLIARQFGNQLRRRRKRFKLADAQIVGVGSHRCFSSCLIRRPWQQKSRQGGWRLSGDASVSNLQSNRDPSSASGIGKP